jgi:polyisoprenoid-binding protein YceI
MSLQKALLAALAAALALPVAAAPVNYALDTDHTHVAFEFPHMGISTWRGLLGKGTGTVSLDRDARTGSVEVSFNTANLAFAHKEMDERAVGEKWFNTGKFPTATYKGAIRFKGANPASVDGELTLMGVTRPLKLKINSFKCIDHPYYKREACGADAEGELHRGEFGLTKGADGDAGKVKLRIQVEGLKQ